MSIRGHHATLSSGALVFAGKSDKTKFADNIYVGFRNSGGDETFLVLSTEAAQALSRLMASPDGADEFPFTASWQAVPAETIVQVRGEDTP